MTADPLTITAVAERAGLRPATIRQHLWRGTMPAPDLHAGQSPLWHPETIDAWLATRRGPGNPNSAAKSSQSSASCSKVSL